MLSDLVAEQLLGFNIRDLKVEETEHGPKGAVRISFVMWNPLGLSTGDLDFEIWFDKSYALSDKYMAITTREYAIGQAKAFLMEEHDEAR